MYVDFLFNKGLSSDQNEIYVQTSWDVTILHWQATVHTKHNRYHSQLNYIRCSVYSSVEWDHETNEISEWAGLASIISQE